jgi:ankyrin repeat protein
MQHTPIRTFSNSSLTTPVLNSPVSNNVTASFEIDAQNIIAGITFMALPAEVLAYIMYKVDNPIMLSMACRTLHALYQEASVYKPHERQAHKLIYSLPNLNIDALREKLASLPTEKECRVMIPAPDTPEWLQLKYNRQYVRGPLDMVKDAYIMAWELLLQPGAINDCAYASELMRLILELVHYVDADQYVMQLFDGNFPQDFFEQLAQIDLDRCLRLVANYFDIEKNSPAYAFFLRQFSLITSVDYCAELSYFLKEYNWTLKKNASLLFWIIEKFTYQFFIEQHTKNKEYETLLDLLLTYGCDLEQSNEDGETALLYLLKKASKLKNEKSLAKTQLFDWVNLLLEEGANCNARTKQGENILTYAVQTYHLPLIEHLLCYPDMDKQLVKKHEVSALLFAIAIDDLPTVKTLLGQLTFYNNNRICAFLYTLWCKKDDIAEDEIANPFLINITAEEKNEFVNQALSDPTKYCSPEKFPELVSLLQYDANCNTRVAMSGMNILTQDFDYRQEALVKSLLQQPNAKTLLGQPTFYNNIRICAFLYTLWCKKGNMAEQMADAFLSNITAEEKNAFVTQALFHTMIYCSPEEFRELVPLLLQYGADCNTRDAKSGMTILTQACAYQQEALVKLLLQQPNIKVNVGDEYDPLLARAIILGNLPILQALLAHPKINIDDFDHDYVDHDYVDHDYDHEYINYNDYDHYDDTPSIREVATPIMYAVSHGSPGAVNLLVQALLMRNKKNPTDIDTIRTREKYIAKSFFKINEASPVKQREMQKAFLHSMKAAEKKVFVHNIKRLAFGKNRAKVAAFLSEEAADYIADEKGKTMLMAACRAQQVEVVKELLPHFAINLNMRDNKGRTALYYAVEQGNASIVQALLNHNTIEEAELFICAFFNAIQYKNRKINTIFSNLMQEPLQIDVINRVLGLAMAPCYKAIFYEFVSYLLEQGADCNTVNQAGDTALIRACFYQQESVVNLLLQQPGIQLNIVNQQGKTALHYAIDAKAMPIIQALLNAYKLSRSTLCYVFNYALEKGQHDIAGMLIAIVEENDFLSEEAECNIVDEKGKTMLIVACRAQQIKVVARLLQYSTINLNIRDNQGRTALYYAVEQGNASIVQALLNHNTIEEAELFTCAFFNALQGKNTEIHTIFLPLMQKPLHIGVVNRVLGLAMAPCYQPVFYKFVSYLLEQGADCNTVNQAGDTALIRACFYQQENVVNLLLQQPGIQLNRVNQQDKTALHYAIDAGSMLIIQALLDTYKLSHSTLLSAFIYALEKSREDIAGMLIATVEEGCSAFIKQALTLAFIKGKWKVVEVLKAWSKMVR